MRFVRHGLVFVSVVHIFLAVMIARAAHHSVYFINEACIKPYKDYDYRTCEPMRIKIDGDHYVIPKGFKTDLASIPSFLWPFIAPQYTSFVAPAILHDYLYNCGNLGSRRWSDEVLYSALLSEGVDQFTSIKFYLAVRLFGSNHFEEHNYFCTRNVYGHIDS